jgi:hypothetical protein
MYGTKVMILVMRTVRTVAVLAIFLLALAGPPNPIMADEGCYDYIMKCTSVEECMEHFEEPCYQPGECEGEIHCYPAEEFSDCYYSGQEAAQQCRLMDPP